ncbi:E2-like conjugating enzyme atg10 [Coemansia sp. RSA 2049]|nr:E2-like conjugating enzyme atg10 [Coemansia sp. RSA 1939]KAJ2515159.1 E2-like conjugating enzyme atg10 [Coemansia sp. RSA 2049]KAJ2591892.1 E2-like conjugating enzyme atg10 [Coemansia sp. RSA 1804]KAJ2684786.1 E2-like conjugating enzyme atg10 [Coemansia sp. RSA 1285]
MTARDNNNSNNSLLDDYPFLTYKEFTRCIRLFEDRFGSAIRADGSSSIGIVQGMGSRAQYLQITRRLYKRDGEKHSIEEELGDSSSDAEELAMSLEDPDPTRSANYDASTVTADDVLSVDNGRVDYHVAYSAGWRVPVLYLQVFVRSNDGTGQNEHAVMDPTAISDALSVDDKDVRESLAAVEFGGALGIQDHPVLGQPFVYLHPCHTATLLRTVGASFAKDDVGAAEYVAAWLSLVGPAVGLTLPSIPSAS